MRKWSTVDAVVGRIRSVPQALGLKRQAIQEVIDRELRTSFRENDERFSPYMLHIQGFKKSVIVLTGNRSPT